MCIRDSPRGKAKKICLDFWGGGNAHGEVRGRKGHAKAFAQKGVERWRSEHIGGDKPGDAVLRQVAGFDPEGHRIRQTKQRYHNDRRTFVQVQSARDQLDAELPKFAGKQAKALEPASVGNVKGITLIIDFSDQPATVPAANFDAYLNQPGYTGYGNHGSVRDYFLYVEDARLDEAHAFFAERLAGIAQVARSADLVEAGYFGSRPASDVLLARLGNLVILPYHGEAVWWYEKDRFEQRFYGHHGGLTRQEMEIPLLALAVSSKTRAPQLPDVPTTLEAGVPNSDYTLWIGILGPVGTPKAVTEKLNVEMKKAFEAPALREKLDKIGVQPMTMSPEEFGALIKNEQDAHLLERLAFMTLVSRD